jgi:pyruvate-ferredoxin/flavodoxin oxidoreductase
MTAWSDLMSSKPKYPGIRVTTDGNHLVSYLTEVRYTEGGVFYPITSSTQMGEDYQLAFSEGKLNVYGRPRIAIETEGEHAAQGGAIALSVTGHRSVNFTSGQGIVYGVEQYYHAPGKASTMVLEVAARALTKHALNVHCGHDDIYGALDVGWTMLFAKDAQQAADQALILRKVNELSLNPGMNIMDGFLTSHLERTFYMVESELIREFLGAPEDEIECPTESQKTLFGPTRRRVPKMVDLENPVLLGPVQNQEHYMNGVIARRNHFVEPILGFLEEAYKEFGDLTGRHYGFLTEHRCDDAETVFVSLGSAAENIEAAVDRLRDESNESVGSIHVNVIRPFPEAAIVKALAGKKNVIILERTDEPMAGDNPIARDIRTALSKATQNHRNGITDDAIPALADADVPNLYRGAYGLGSRDFRPEGILGAYEFVCKGGKRQDGRTAADGETFFVVGIDHPYAVVSQRTPSLLPTGAIAVRLHSIGGWGMITTGKNLGGIIGALGDYLADERGEVDEWGRKKELIHVSANPKYGSEKKGAPTSYFLVMAPERIRVNCDLRHVSVVLCCDPKAFTHMNPLDGMAEGGAFVWESNESPDMAWKRIPPAARKQIIEKNIRLFILPGFDIARNATDRPDLQLRMQGNAFLGAFFSVSSFLNDYDITPEHYREVVHKQYVDKFGRFGDAVVESNMTVMTAGFEQVQEVPYGDLDAEDLSSMRGAPLTAVGADGCMTCREYAFPEEQLERDPIFQMASFDAEFRAGYGYNQPATALASVGVMAAASGATSSKYVARRETPVFIAENCTQCMDCIAACPDTALPNTAQELKLVLATAIQNYVKDADERMKLVERVGELDTAIREKMNEAIEAKEQTPIQDHVRAVLDAQDDISFESKRDLYEILDILPLAYAKTNAIFKSVEKKSPGDGGIFQIYVSDLCKGCAECVDVCGDHDALRMVPDTEDLNSQYAASNHFFNLLPDTPQKYLGLYDNDAPQDSRPATLKNHLMVRSNYEALVSGDGACAGCGEKSVLRALASVTEAYMRPLFHKKANRLDDKADRLNAEGAGLLESLKSADAESYKWLKRSLAHVILGLGGESDKDTDARMEAHGDISDADVIGALTAIMKQEAFNHRDLQATDGRLPNGMSVMAMGAHTGCNTVYGSTPPNNPHPYPWMNSLFQDGATITWIFGESFIMDHSRRSIVPERLADVILDGGRCTEADYFDYTHFTDVLMTDDEIHELPKAWCIGGDGGMGDIGFQNVSKVILQNRPNVKLLMLDTQVYSNTGGQNSDSSPSPGGGDMNQLGAATQGKLVEMKALAEIFTVGHGSPYVARVSMANAPKMYKALLDGLEYRGTAFYQSFTTCQPEHGVGDDMSEVQAKRIRDSRGLPEFISNPQLGETHGESMDLKGNPTIERDWWMKKAKADGEVYAYTVAHWAVTEGRFRRHFKRVKEDQLDGLIHIEDILPRVTQNDVIHRRFLDESHRAYVPDFQVYLRFEETDGSFRYHTMSRQMVLFCVERRKAWRMLQSRAGIENPDYDKQKALLAKVDAGEITIDQLREGGKALLEEPEPAAT